MKGVDSAPNAGRRWRSPVRPASSRTSPAKSFAAAAGHPSRASPTVAQPKFGAPESYTPKHLAEKILTSKAALEGERKQVTVLFADLKGSMELLADRDPEEARKLLDPVLERMMDAVHRYEGTVNQVMGDGIMALFGAPLAHEDHAVRACYAALQMQASVARYAETLRRTEAVGAHIRVGLNSGEVVVRSVGSDLRMDYSAVGQTTNLAARLEQMASPGSTFITAATLRLAEGYVEVRPLGLVQIKGLPEPVDVHELTGAAAARTRFQVAAIRGLSRFVGREVEIDQLRRALGQAGQGQGQIVAVIGEAGVGKSRLVHELIRSHRVHEWLVLESASVSYGRASPWLPVIDLLKAYFRIGERDDHREMREKVTGKLLTLDRVLEPLLPVLLSLLQVPVDDPTWTALDPLQRRQRTLDAVRHLLLREARAQPLLVVFEDLHWIDSESQALLDALVDSLPVARLLLLVNYRPEYQHGWGPKSYYTQLRLDALPEESAGELLRALLGDAPTLAPLRALLMSIESRGAAVLGCFLITVALGACSAASRPPQSTPRDLLLQTARQCERETSGVHVWGVNERGQVEFSSRTSEERRKFTDCVGGRAQERIERAKAALAPGRPVPAADGSRQTSIPIVVTGNLIRVELIANGSEHLTLLLDTGASRTTLRSATANRLGIDPPPNAPRWPTTLADGRVIVVPYTRLRSLGLGSLTVEDNDVGVYDLLPGASAVDGILGGEVLGHFLLTIDRRRERLELEIK